MAADSPIFQKLRLAGWRQFDSVNIEFHPRLTVLTGANGAGKSTLLNILSTNLGVSRPYLSVPQKNKSGTLQFFNGLFEIPKRFTEWLNWTRPSPQHFGEVTYSNGATSRLVVPVNSGLTYNLDIENRQPVLGFHVPSHRLLPTYQQLPESMPYAGIDPDSAFNILINENYSPYQGGHTNSSVVAQLKKLLTSWKAVGEGNSVIDRDPRQQTAYDGFIDILKKILPAEIGFESVIVRYPDVLLQTQSGTFLIDAASGGLVTIIELAAIIYSCSIRPDVKGGKFVVTFDEPENHLHPSLQRTLMPTLVNAFPDTQFIIATHSPFMVSSLKESNVYVLRYVDSGEKLTTENQLRGTRRVETIKLDYINRAGPASEMLRDVLGVPVTLPTWVETDLARIVARYQSRPISESLVAELKADLAAHGLTSAFPDALTELGQKR